jgi:hypothetical protein
MRRAGKLARNLLLSFQGISTNWICTLKDVAFAAFKSFLGVLSAHIAATKRRFGVPGGKSLPSDAGHPPKLL